MLAKEKPPDGSGGCRQGTGDVIGKLAAWRGFALYDRRGDGALKASGKRLTLLLVGMMTLLRLIVAPTFGLGVDEAHYFLYAYFLDWSYVDHPPLVGWAHWPLYKMFGTNEFLVRVPAILLFAAVSVLLYHWVRSFSRSSVIAFLSVAAVNSSFLFNAMSVMLLPDCFLLLLIFPLMETIRKIAAAGPGEGRTGDFLLLGLLLGLAGLAKYTAILFVPPLIVYILMKKRYDLLYSPRMLLAAGIALIVISPVLYWNIRHDFISFRYQGGHVLAAAAPSLKSFLVSLLAQCGAYSPLLFAVAFFGLGRSWKAADDRLRLAVLFGVTLLIFFFYSSLYERTLPHWPSLFYLLFIPVGAYCLLASGSRKQRNFFYFSMGFSLTLTLFLYAALPAKWFTFPDYQSPFRDIVGYELIAREADALLRQGPPGGKEASWPGAGTAAPPAPGGTSWPVGGGGERILSKGIVATGAVTGAAGIPVAVPGGEKNRTAAEQATSPSPARKTALAATNWTLGSRLIYYSLPYGRAVFVLDDRTDQFDVWQSPPLGYDLLFVKTHFHGLDIAPAYRCDACASVKKMDIVLNGGKVDSVEFVWCRNYRGPK